LKQLVTCIDKGIAPVQATLDQVAIHVADLRVVYSTLDPATGSRNDRRNDFDEMADIFRASASSIGMAMAGVMDRFAPGLFVKVHPAALPNDNLDLERAFRLPKGHERRIHGHAHAGVRIVIEGPTLLPTLDAHARHPTPFAAEDLIGYQDAPTPPSQRAAELRRTIMRRARSRKERPKLLAELERRYNDSLGS
jgi:hypothetical protein